MKKNTILFVLAILLIGGYLLYSNLTANSLTAADTVETDSFTIDMPKAYYEEDGYYFNNKSDTIIEWYFFGNEFELDAEGMMYMVEYIGFSKDDFISVEEVEIDGIKSYQAEYRMFTTDDAGNEEYCDEGIVTVIPLENEFLVLDAYKWTDAALSEDKNITDSEMQLLKDIAATIKITDDDYDNIGASPKTMTFDKLSLDLTDTWVLDETHEAGVYDFGYYASYEFSSLAVWVDVTEYTVGEDASYAANGALEDYQYTYMGEGTIGGEMAYLYAYDAYTTDGDIYLYGVYALSEHYFVDMYFYGYEDSYELSEEAQQKIVELILTAE